MNSKESIEKQSWCELDKHEQFEYYSDFNEWIDSDEGQLVKENNNIDNLTNPSKAFYASDRQAYNQAFISYKAQKRNEVLSEEYLKNLCGDDHWFKRNLERFDQLVECLSKVNVVPFIGAGLSVDGGFPTWKEHLMEQGRTAGLDSNNVKSALESGQFEKIIDEIERARGRDVFIQEIRDSFFKDGELNNLTQQIPKLFMDTIITTNYDRLLEQAYDAAGIDIKLLAKKNMLKNSNSYSPILIKLHGNIKNPTTCIISKLQYDEAYGNTGLDLSLPIPKIIKYYYSNSSLFFIGCSINEDRTIQVIKEVKEEIGDTDRPQHFALEEAPETEADLLDRNAYLLNLGITAIWFEKERYDFIEQILIHLQNELKYRGLSSVKNTINTENNSNIVKNKYSFYRKVFELIRLIFH